jgi:eukaryotic-like serine/threonine-protein kinase
LADRYVIECELGRGGMATVYLAHDIRHDRPVALKVLHPELSAVLGPERFLAEIRLTAQLQHPHILPLFDSGMAEGLLYYMMPYVEGEALRSRLAREHQLPVADTVRIATEVADALGYAHRRAVVHRDIKPENILLRDGHALVADFGIALAVQQAAGDRMTQTGLSLGTPAYMSPEQAMGERHLDGRVDIYALGAVTYEMLTGDPPFTGPNAQAIAAKVLTEAPRPLTRQRPSVPEHVEAAVLTALEKLPADRFSSAKEFAFALTGGPGSPTITRRTSHPVRPSLSWRSAAAALALAAGGAAVGVVATRGSTPASRYRPVWIEMAPPGGTAELLNEDLVLSPDGSRYLFARGRTGSNDIRLVIRGFADTTETVLEATAGAVQTMWSPDGQSIAFLRGALTGARTLLILPLDGRPPTVTADSVGCLGAWLPGDTIVYTMGGSIWAVSARGGEPRLVRAGDSTAALPQFRCPAALPGRRVIVPIAALSTAESQVGVVSLDGGELRILARGVGARYVATGHLLLAQADGRLLAASFDPATATLAGRARPVLTDLDTRSGLAELSVANDGTLAYQAGQTGGQLVSVGRKGDERVLTDDVRNYNDLAGSPNGRWVATGIDGVLWSYDRRRQARHSTGSRPVRISWAAGWRSFQFGVPTVSVSRTWQPTRTTSYPATAASRRGSLRCRAGLSAAQPGRRIIAGCSSPPASATSTPWTFRPARSPISWRVGSLSRHLHSRRTGGGWPTHPMNRVVRRCTYDDFRGAAAAPAFL